MIVRRSGEVQMSVKSERYSELDIGGRETCLSFSLVDMKPV